MNAIYSVVIYLYFYHFYATEYLLTIFCISITLDCYFVRKLMSFNFVNLFFSSNASSAFGVGASFAQLRAML